MQQSQAFDLVRHAFRAGRLPHAYCVVGPPRGAARALADRVAALLLCEKGGDSAPCGACDPCGRVARGVHPDVFQVGPEMKSRAIGIEAMRERLLPWAAEKSFSGGWKAGIVLFADRLTPEAGNAILKTLEEPPENTLFLLLTDNPDALLPTIASRCQKIDLSEGRAAPPEPWRTLVGEAMAAHSCQSALRVAATAARLHAVFARIKEEAEAEVDGELEAQKAADPLAWSQPDSDAVKAMVSVKEKERRRAVYQSIQEWYRDILAAAALAEAGEPPPPRSALCFPEHRDEIAARAASIPTRLALKFIDAVGNAAVQIEDRNLPDQHVFLQSFTYLR